ncbi:MAG: phage head-tail adapter protein [Oscillospiraceae bacterium]
MIQSKLFVHLPDYINTPDGMAIDRDGHLILSCPNYADTSTSGCVVRIDKETRAVTKWFDTPVSPETGCARNMGIALRYRENGWCDIFLCDNQGWSGAEELLYKGRMLRVTMDGEKMVEWKTIAKNMEHPNGVRVWRDQLYVTQSQMTPVNDPSGKLVSCVYRFDLDDEDIDITNTLADKNLLVTYLTHNPDCQYGADGIVFDSEGAMYVGNFGDGEVYKTTFHADGTVKEHYAWAKDSAQLQSTDGMDFDNKGNLYIADFSANAIARITPDGKVERLAQSPDKSGYVGGLEQPGEPIFYQGGIVASCFDLVTGPDKINTGHEMPATLAWLDL